MQIEPLDASDPHAMAAWHDAYLAADTTGRDHPTPFMLEELRAQLLARSPGERRIALSGVEQGEVVCVGQLELPLKDHQHLAWAGVWTPPAQRRRGHGSAMLDRLLNLAREHGRSQVTAEVVVPFDAPEDGAGHPDADWAHRRGFRLDISNVVRVLDLPVDVARVRQLAEQAAPHHRDYTMRQFVGAVPDDIVEEFGRLVGALMVEAPSGEVAKEQEQMDLDRIRSDEAVFEASGRRKYTTVAVAEDGTLAAYTELVAPRHDPAHVFQWGTLVLPQHRGHRLGMAVKAHNLLWVQEEEPGRSALVTANAEVNEVMIAVNEALGFRPVERAVDLVRDLDARV